jgi:aryl-alcohol dehydrogenase-like predicted oxidoreductase
MALGLAALGRPGYINLGHAGDLHNQYDVVDMQANAEKVLDAAWSAGVRYFDTARSYGRGEEFLAHWLISRQIPASAVTIGSKWGYVYTADWQVAAQHHEIKDHSIENLRRQAAESRRLLGDQLDLYQIHSATLESGVLDNRDVLDELARLRDGGLRIGLSVSGPRQAETIHRALEIAIDGRCLFDSVQATWNVLETSAGAVLQSAHEAGVGVIVKEALANGRLTARNNDAAFAAKRAVLDAVSHELGTSLDAVALAAVLAQPWVDVVLSGAAIGEQLESNLAAPQIVWTTSCAERMKTLAEPAEQYWATRARLAWN